MVYTNKIVFKHCFFKKAIYFTVVRKKVSETKVLHHNTHFSDLRFIRYYIFTTLEHRVPYMARSWSFKDRWVVYVHRFFPT